jgi:ABC-type phosphate/phosphonate transport system permease subunit
MALFGLSLSIGVLAAIWFQITMWQPWLIAWVGFGGWASFYYAGGDVEGLKKSIAANVAGMTQGAIFFWLWTQFGGGNVYALSAIIGIYCFIMTFEGNIGLLAAIPGQFVGAAIFFANLGGHNGEIGTTLLNTFVIMIIGNLFGILSAKLPGFFAKKEESPESTA